MLAAAAATGLAETMDCGNGCTVTCPDGGGCVYSDGKCYKFCNHNGVIQVTPKGKPNPFAKNAKLTIRFQNLTQEELKKALSQVGIR